MKLREVTGGRSDRKETTDGYFRVECDACVGMVMAEESHQRIGTLSSCCETNRRKRDLRVGCHEDIRKSERPLDGLDVSCDDSIPDEALQVLPDKRVTHFDRHQLQF
jgi:hypothetical protein